MKIKTSELTGPALDWAVLRAQGQDFTDFNLKYISAYQFSTDWTHGGPIIEIAAIALYKGMECSDAPRWQAYTFGKSGVELMFAGPTPLISAMRCYVASKLGDSVDIPSELL